MTDIIVVGGGPAGMMAAATAAQYGAKVMLIEKNDCLGKKMRITGKGRCNVTNCCDRTVFLANIAHNPKFLFSAFTAFDAQDTMQLFEKLGVPLKVERGNRVFPQSDKAADVVNALIQYVKDCGVEIVKETVTEICADASVHVRTNSAERDCKKCIIATGGLSYPLTGSTGDGYKFASEFGHTIIPPRASLVGLRCAGSDCLRLAGLSLKNISLTVRSGHKTVFNEFGEMLFTHTGISGPLVLSASAHLEEGKAKAIVNLKPALSEQQLDRRILRDFSENINKDLLNALNGLLPKKIIPIVLEHARLAPHIKIHQITKEQRQALLQAITAFTLDIAGKESLEGAIITAGGVSTRELLPGSMQSKCNPNIYFAGEIIDVDAYTGGFNLQIAFSTGYAAGQNAAGGLYETN